VPISTNRFKDKDQIRLLKTLTMKSSKMRLISYRLIKFYRGIKALKITSENNPRNSRLGTDLIQSRKIF